MKEFLKKRVFKLSTFRIGILISLIFFTGLVLQEERGWDLGFLDLMELKALDVKFENRGERETTGQVVIATVDEKSIEAYGRWPWNRVLLAQLIGKLAESGVSVIAFDIFLTDPDNNSVPKVINVIAEGVDELEPEECKDCEPLREAVLEYLRGLLKESNPDAILADIIERVDRVILGYFLFTQEEEVKALKQDRLKKDIVGIDESKITIMTAWDNDEAENYDLNLPKGLAIRAPLEILRKATKDYGHVSFMQDSDGAMRWADLIKEIENGNPETRLIHPSLALKTVAKHLDKEIVLHTYPRGIDRISLGLGSDARDIPTDYRGKMLVNYHGPAGTFPTYSVVDILESKIPVSKLKDHIVIIGATATGVFDLRVTPFQENFPGVEIHANIMHNILENDYISRPDWTFLYELFFILFVGVFFGLLLGKVPALVGAITTLVVLAAYYVIDRMFFFENGYWVRSIIPLSEAFIIFLLCYIYRYMTEEKEKKQTRAAFKQYLNEEVIDHIMSDYDSLGLGGVKREISVLFSDIRGFTSISETLSPEDLGKILTDYMNPMTQIIFDHNGVLDKYIGDAVMAFWGAPEPIEDHADKACTSALTMLSTLETLNKEWKVAGLPELEIGIGINTGNMWVGNMGSHIRFDYTVLGDNVNLASRLESINKQYGSNLIISEATKARLTKPFLCRELDMLRVKGKSIPVTIFELMAEGNGNDSQKFISDKFAEGIKLYRGQHWDDAILTFNNILSEFPDDNPSKIFIERCNMYKAAPPEENWDGVTVMTTK